MFGEGDGAWINWVGRWTAEEGRHAIVLRDYLTVTRNIDPIALERGRMTQLQQGYDRDATDTLHGLAYVAFQELATRISHRNTGRYSDDPVADKIMIRIAADENLHMVFYRDILAAALEIQPSAAVRAIVDEVLAFQMPGAGIPGFLRKAAAIAKAGIYDLRIHRDEVLLPILQHWRIFELTGLDAAAEDARRRLADHLEKLDAAAKRFEEKLARSGVPRMQAGVTATAPRAISGRGTSPGGRPSGRSASAAGSGRRRRAPGTPARPRTARASASSNSSRRPTDSRPAAYAARNAAVVSAIQLATRATRAPSTRSATTRPTWSRLVVIWATSRAAGWQSGIRPSPRASGCRRSR